MRKVVTLALMLLFASSVAFAQAGSIGIFSDVGGTDCALWDNVFGVAVYNVVYVNHGGCTAVQYAAPTPACLGAMYLSDQLVWSVNIGTSQAGISTGTGGCIAAPTHVLGIQYFCQLTTGTCCYYPVIPHPASASGLIEATDCVFATVYPTGGEGIVNPDGTCLCDVPAQDSTWGQVKSLYAE